MSGDVQPRKRRDKKKKKEDTAEEIIIQHQQHVAPSAVIAEDLNIHVQKELSTGGGWCAKLIFFILLTILSTLIGLIITEHRGITDLDKVDAESRFTQLFEGWTDTSSVTYDYSDPYNGEHSEENDDESEEGHQEVDENDEDEDNDDHSDENTHEEEEEEVSDQEDEEVSNIEDDNTGENGEIEMLNADENEDEATESQDENEQDDLTQEYQSEIEQSDEEQGNDSEYAGEDDDEISEENDYIQEDEELEAQKMESEETLNDIKLKISQTDDGSNDDENDDEEDDEDDNEKDEIENVLDEDTAKQEEAVSNVRQRKPSSNEVKKSEEDLIENTNAENTDYVNMVVKFGVGTALLVVAHVVLIQKWRNDKVSEKISKSEDEDDEKANLDLSRRDTIVSPPPLEEIQKLHNVEEEYTEDEDDIDSEDDTELTSANVKSHYQDLRSTYSHTLSPDWEPTTTHENIGKDEEEDNEGDEEYDDELSENEDDDLLERLEAKYGKIQQSDDEQDVDDEEYDEDGNEDDDEDELEEDDGADYDNWKHIQVSKSEAIVDSDSENENGEAEKRTGAQAVYDFSNITNVDDYKIREELDRAQQQLSNE